MPEYTDIEILDTLEVLGHERYEELLKKAGVLNEQFIDWRTRAVLKRNAEGTLVPVTETTQVPLPIGTTETITPARVLHQKHLPTMGGAVIQSVEEHTEKAEEQVAKLLVELAPRSDLPRLEIPKLKMTQLKNEFSLADITDRAPFRDLGEALRPIRGGAPQGNSQRSGSSEGADGLRRTELVTAPAIDRVESPATLYPLEELQKPARPASPRCSSRPQPAQTSDDPLAKSSTLS